MKYFIIAIFPVILMTTIILTTGCTQTSLREQESSTIYDGCCGTQPKVMDLGDLSVYIPNVITANGDGINDVFIPQASIMNNAQFHVVQFYIYDTIGNVIYYAQGLDVEDAANWGFTGIASTRPFLPDELANYKYTGKFSYAFTMGNRKSDGSIEQAEVTGDACVVRCDESAHVLKTKNGCYFPVQGMNGIYDETLPNQEEKCIK